MRRGLALRRGLAAVALTLGVGLAVPAHAIEYEVFIDIDDSDDLLELFNTDQISESTFNTLVELLARGTNLDTADRETLYTLPNLTYADVDRILAFRTEAGRITDPAALVVAGAISRRKLAAIAPFILVARPPGAKIGVDGYVRYQTIYSLGDGKTPPMVLDARVNTLRNLTLGFAAGLDRNRIGNVTYDPNRDALSADPQRVRVRVPKFFAQWDTEKWGIIGGTYRIGFGQRLTFDSTNRYTPNGFVLDQAVQRRYDLTQDCTESAGELEESPCADNDRRVSPDYAFREGQMGVAAGAKHIELPVGWLQTYGWFSATPRSIYQYQLYDRSRCADPNDDDDDNCSAPYVFHRNDPPLDPQSRYSFETLPNMYNELMGGTNVSYFYDRRTHVGVTGYGASPAWLVKDADLDFQEWARTPYGGPFGAVGADFGWGRGIVDLFGEVSRSFDSMHKVSPEGGGGFATIVRNTITLDDHEVEISLRYYDRDYANPYAGPIAAPTVSDGLRARDEAGGRIRYNAHLFDRLDLRTYLDLWGVVSERKPQGRVYTRADVQATKWVRPGLWLEYQRRDLRPTDPVACFETSNDEDVEQAQCGGQRFSITPRARFDPHRKVYLTLQYRHDIQDDHYEVGGVDFTGDPVDAASGSVLTSPLDSGNFDLVSRRRQDINAFFTVGVKPIDKLRLRTRWRWYWEDISDNSRFEHSVWGYFDASYTIRRWAIPRVRYDLVIYLDGRDSTADRPNPEHWFLFEFASRF